MVDTGGMRSKALLPALWFVGMVVAATVAWYALSLVGASIDGGDAVAIEVGVGDRPTDPADGDRESGPTSTTPPTTTTVVAEPASTTSSAVENDQARTFDLIGGRVAIQFEPDGVSVVWATPVDGYRTEMETSDDEVEVTFDNGARRSSIEAWWDDGPGFDIEERDRSGPDRDDDSDADWFDDDDD